MRIPRRTFLKSTSVFAGSALLHQLPVSAVSQEDVSMLPAGAAPEPVSIPHFPDRLHAFVWRNWTMVPVDKIAQVTGATADQIRSIGESMGLPSGAKISREQERRSYITIIRRNWHLLPYDQLLQLLDWSAEHMAYMLREDDFLFIKLGSLKPACKPLRYSTPSNEAMRRAREISETLKSLAPDAFTLPGEPPFSFVSDLSAALPAAQKHASDAPRGENSAPRFCYSYFALYGDPLLEPDLDPYPEGYLQRLSALGVNGVWLQGVLQKLAPLPWYQEDAGEREKRLNNLRSLARTAARHGIGIYLYLNEPRSLPQKFFAKSPQIKGVSVSDYACVCTSTSVVQDALRDAIAYILAAVPELAGFFTISASENPTNCWSHGAGSSCPRCGKRSAAEVIAEVNTVFYEGIQRAREKSDTKATLIVWDWGWRDEWAEGIVKRLPRGVMLQSVSEWSIPIKRGGIDSVVGEYSISVVGPGPRAKRHWELARKRGLRTIAKIQAGNTWELSAVPYIPALENVARHAAQLKEADVDGLMLGWTLGGYPSPNLQVACELATAAPAENDPIEQKINRALKKVALDRFGPELAGPMTRAWKAFSAAFSEFPYHGGLVYNAPMQYGPANLLWLDPTGYRATMVGFPYDDLDAWRQVYPVEVFIQQFNKIADGFDAAIDTLKQEAAAVQAGPAFAKAFGLELNVAAAAAIHFRSTANQAQFVDLRKEAKSSTEKSARIKELLRAEIAMARQLHRIQSRDSRIGFEATNHYFYVPQDLLEKNHQLPIPVEHNRVTLWNSFVESQTQVTGRVLREFRPLPEIIRTQPKSTWICLRSKVPDFPLFARRTRAPNVSAFCGDSIRMKNQKLVLLVEDEQAVRILAKTALQRSSFAVIDAEKIDDAMKLWDQHSGQIDLLVTDLTLRDGGNGSDLAQRLRQLDASLPIIIASGNAPDSYSAAVEKCAGCVALPKPYNMSALIELAHTLTAG